MRREENQLDVSECFIALMICCTTLSCSIPLPGLTACCSVPDHRQPVTKYCTPWAVTTHI